MTPTCSRLLPTMLPLAMLLLVALAAACAADTSRFDGRRLDEAIEAATGHHLRDVDERALPPGIDPTDGVDEDEAVALALWNNVDLRAALATFGVRRAELAEAGLLRNPLLSVLFPIGPKQLEFTFTWPLDSLLQRSRRIEIATGDCERLAAELVLHGLDLVRAVRLAFADREVAAQRARLAGERALVEQRLLSATTRLGDAGSLGELEVDAARFAALEVDAERDRLQAEVPAAEARLRSLLGPLEAGVALSFGAAAAEAGPQPAGFGDLDATALAARPDLRAAELQLEVAGQRAGLATRDWLRLSAIVDANGDGSRGFEIGPGLAGELPLLHQGDRAASTAAAVEAAAAHYAAVRHHVLTAVEAARLDFAHREQQLQRLRADLRPAALAALDQQRQLVARGQEPETVVLAAERRVLDVDLRAAEAEAALRRARAELEHAVGCRIRPLETP